MPLKARTVGCEVPATPDKRPVSMRTCSGIMAAGRAMSATTPNSAQRSPSRFMDTSKKGWFLPPGRITGTRGVAPAQQNAIGSKAHGPVHAARARPADRPAGGRRPECGVDVRLLLHGHDLLQHPQADHAIAIHH